MHWVLIDPCLLYWHFSTSLTSSWLGLPSNHYNLESPLLRPVCERNLTIPASLLNRYVCLVNLQIVHKVKCPYGIMSIEENVHREWNVHTKYIGLENVHKYELSICEDLFKQRWVYMFKRWQSFSLVSIVLNLTANFPVRIDKKKFVQALLL